MKKIQNDKSSAKKTENETTNETKKIQKKYDVELVKKRHIRVKRNKYKTV